MSCVLVSFNSSLPVEPAITGLIWSKKAKTTILNYGIIKDNIKSLTKQSSLIKDEILPYFEKQNAIVLVGMDNGYEGYAQRINRESKRFDTSKFKEDNPKIYAKYLVEGKSTEIKVSFKVVDAKH